jgi:glyoxylase-like metal-dependent hydrolase (beta-lactamase superfamily II)
VAAFGETSHQFFQSFASMGLALDFPFFFVAPMEIAPGVYFLTGGSHNSLAVEQENGVVIIEAPNYPERADAILAWAAQTFPNKPVTHVIATHHHLDHAAGLRSFVAAGATVVLHEVSETYFFDEVFAAPSTLSPDALEMAPIAADILPVTVDGEILDDASIPITLSHLTTGHCTDMVLIHVGTAGGIVFVSDLYNPGNGGSSLSPVLAQELLTAIEAGEPTATIAGGHGGVAPLAELQAFLN